MSDATQVGWDAAVDACCNGHDDCSFGGMSIPYGYWLAADDCPLNHGETCAWCPAEAVTGFRGRVHDSPLGALFSVPACHACADQWTAAHPEWTRERPERPSKSSAEVLAEWRALLSPPPQFTGILGFLADGGEQR